MQRITGLEVQLNERGRGAISSLQFQDTETLDLLQEALKSQSEIEVLTPAGWRTARVTSSEVQQGPGMADILVFHVAGA